MCGIAGIVTSGFDRRTWQSTLCRMNRALSHRGPDDSGIWYDVDAGVGLSHARLSIQDLTHRGHQPMISSDGRYYLTYNGEIYNFIDLRSDLEKLGHRFHGGSDTEVMLAAFVEWGFERTVKSLEGMFAFGLWDSHERVLHLARDRLGEKPLYYARLEDGIAFASELKALKTLPNCPSELDPASVNLLLTFGYIPAPWSIWKKISKLPAGASVAIRPEDTASTASPRRYWNISQAILEGIQAPLSLTTQELVDEADAILRRAVRRQMVADVPIGALLSGGTDSSLVVALMQSQSAPPIRTFTVAFGERQFNEAPMARAVAAHLGTEHTETHVSPRELLGVIDEVSTIWDEPFADPSQVPTTIIARVARSRVKVVLSGDGGDELFAGYPRYREATRLWSILGRLPPPWRHRLAHFSSSCLLPLARPVSGSLSRTVRRSVELMNAGAADRLYALLAYQLSGFEEFTDDESNHGSVWPPPDYSEATSELASRHLQRFMLWDLVHYLPEDLLVKLDRAAMHVGLEARVPLLDPQVVRLSCQVPLEYKLRRGEGKWLLRQVLRRYLPEHLITRSKRGFEVPLGSWLRTSLRPWADDLLDASRLRDQGLVPVELVVRRWQEHLTGARDWRFFLWRVLMLQQWLSATLGTERAHRSP